MNQEIVGKAENQAKELLDAKVCFGSVEYCINLVGEIEFITDESKNETWYGGLEHYFKGQMPLIMLFSNSLQNDVNFFGL